MTDLTTKAAGIRAGLVMTSVEKVVGEWRAAMEGVTPGEWAPGCIVRAESGCQCRYIFGGDYMGAIAEVYVDNGIRGLGNGQNDCPPVDEARANASWIARCSPAGIAPLLALIEQQAAELAARHERYSLDADELLAVAGAIGSARFMDPPDGGDVSLAEQVKRMREALTAAESERDELLREKERLGAALRAYHDAYSDRRFAPEGSHEAYDAAARLEDAHSLAAALLSASPALESGPAGLAEESTQNIGKNLSEEGNIFPLPENGARPMAEHAHDVALAGLASDIAREIEAHDAFDCPEGWTYVRAANAIATRLVERFVRPAPAPLGEE